MGGGEERPDKDGPELGLILLTVTTITSQSVRSQSLCLIKLQGQTEGERGEEVDQLLSIENTGRKRWITIL